MPTMPPAHIVVVDDDAASAAATAKLLARLGCNARTCDDPAQAVAVALDGSIDLVCLDLGMPTLDGFEVLLLIRSHEKTRRVPSVPVITITGRVAAADKARALASGFASHLDKPVRLDALKHAIGRALTLRDPLHRTRYSVDSAALRARVDGLCADGERLGVVAGLAAAVEQQGESMLHEALLAAYGGQTAEAVATAARLATFAGSIGARQLAALAHAFADAMTQGAQAYETAAVLARAEIDRIVFTLREQVLG
ncbi:response regulator [Azohydromonas sediminis]|uniref:response regulator n=1 Tax=Azohydromonas sediminis TaxID=2259674 RepID=UPI0013C2FB9E|nr:response regulator [Azohydromonas sediminis]